MTQKNCMKERPILFSGPMVKAILDGKKTQTRRIIKPQPQYVKFLSEMECPYGSAGDCLWVRETWGCYTEHYEDATYFLYTADFPPGAKKYLLGDEKCDLPLWRPSIHMPKEACRLWLEITNVRAERLQDINEKDAIAEGFQSKDDFVLLWDNLNFKRGFSWDSKPWVWVIEFKVVHVIKQLQRGLEE